eukprot:14843667-Heterocapsa_arctica.AAC.1
MAYDALVLSTGSNPVVPPLMNLNMDVAGAIVFRTIDDLENMINFARQSKRVTVIDGDLLGL